MSKRFDMRRWRPAWIAAALVIAVSVGARSARADGPAQGEGFIQPPPTVQQRMYSVDKWEIAVLADFSLGNVLTQHEGAALNIEKNFGEYIGVELLAGGGYGGTTDLVNVLRSQVGAFNHVGVDDLKNGGALDAYAQLGARLTPFYGKLNLMSELTVHFDFYLNFGVGLAYVTYNSILGCNQNIESGGICPDNSFHQDSLPAFAFNGGGGMRLFIDQLWTIRVEVRDMVFPDHYYTNMNLTDPASSNTFSSANLARNPGLTQVPLFFVGLGWLL